MKYQTVLVLCLASCAAAPFSGSEGLDGIWMSDGYGIVAEIQDSRARAYQFAGDYCLPDGQSWERLASFFSGIKVELQADGKTALFASPFAQHRIKANRIAALPPACRNPPEDTPIGNFEAFVAFFEHSYAFFDLYGVDWQEAVKSARSQIRPDISDKDLFQVMARMMAPLRDGHLELNGRDGRKDLTFKPNVGRTHRALQAAADRSGRTYGEQIDMFHEAFWKGSVQDRILKGGGVFAGNRRIQYGVVDGDIGYIALVTLAGYNRDRPEPERDLQTVNDVMEGALQDFQHAGVRAVVLDLSVNYGGFDFVSRAVAERFASQKTHAYTKHAGDAEEPIRTQVFLNPSSETRFEGPVYVMTSNVTVSAGEVLTMALRALSNVTHVGEPTRGALSDVLDRTLPNGWELSLSNEVYLDSDGVTWEGRGIQPDWDMSVFPDEQPIAGHWAAIQSLLSKI
ncbi:MAG: S41 family peptidase [Litoreibacter sp.]|nr:S41 family peptidase [Litoreibacter sp.]